MPPMSESTATTRAAVGRTYFDYAKPWYQRLLVNRESAVIAALVIVIIYAWTQVPYFAQPITFTYLLLDIMPILLIALPMTLVIITGEIDLSVASTVGLSSVVLGTLSQAGVPLVGAAIIS